MTPTREDLEALAARVEAAEGADCELDDTIYVAITGGCLHKPWVTMVEVEPGEREPVTVCKLCGSSAIGVPRHRYTASLDAAMTLEEGCLLVFMSDLAADGLPAVCLCSDTSTSPPVEHWGIALASGSRQGQLARAYTAAALRARASALTGYGEKGE